MIPIEEANDTVLLAMISGVVIPAVGYFIYALKKKDQKIDTLQKKVDKCIRALTLARQQTHEPVTEDTLKDIQETDPGIDE